MWVVFTNGDYVGRFDPKTEKMETFRPPIKESEFGDGHLTMIDPAFQHVDGKLWVNVAFATGEPPEPLGIAIGSGVPGAADRVR